MKIVIKEALKTETKEMNKMWKKEMEVKDEVIDGMKTRLEEEEKEREELSKRMNVKLDEVRMEGNVQIQKVMEMINDITESWKRDVDNLKIRIEKWKKVSAHTS